MEPENKLTLYFKGNGSSYCLLNSKKQDSDQFIAHDFPFSIKNFKGLYVGGYMILAFFSEEQIYIWGQLGTLSLLQSTKLNFKFKILELSCGWQHALFLSKEGMVLGLGSNKSNQLSIKDPQKQIQQYYLDPVLLGLQNCSKICAGFRQSYVIRKQGKILGCGQSKNYQLGIQSKKCQWIQIEDENEIGENIRKISAAKKFVMFLTEKGIVFGLGSNDYNSFNQTQFDKTKKLQKITQIFPKNMEQQKQLGKITDIECGWTHVILKNSHNQIYTFGRNNFGQLGRSAQNQNLQVKIPNTGDSISIKAGSQFSFALTDEKLYGWGWNQHFNIVNSKQPNIYQPTLIQTDVLNIWTGSAVTVIQKKQ